MSRTCRPVDIKSGVCGIIFHFLFPHNSSKHALTLRWVLDLERRERRFCIFLLCLLFLVSGDIVKIKSN